LAIIVSGTDLYLVLLAVYMVKHLYVDEDRFSKQYWQDNIRVDNTQWLELFQPFTAMKNLYLSRSCIATTLKDPSEERITEVFPPWKAIFGRVSAISAGPGSPWEVCRRVIALRSPYNYFSLGRCKILYQ
jgi:hypothetical protein